MPYDRENKIVYVDPSTDPDLGVEIADIQKVVPVTIKRTVNGVTEAKSSSDLGVLCSAQVGDSVPDNAGGAAWIVSSRIPINVWAKYKPVRYGYLDTTKDPVTGAPWLNNDKTWKTNEGTADKWWRNPQGTGGNGTYRSCGFLIPAQGNIDENVELALVEWTYERPEGQGTRNGVAFFEPYRKLDFNWYYHNAICPFRIEFPDSKIQKVSTSSGPLLKGLVKFYQQKPVGALERTLNLTMSDIFAQAFGSFYFGIAVVIGSAVWVKTQSSDESSISLEGLESQVNVGDTIRIVAFGARQKRPGWTVGDHTIGFSLKAPGINFPVAATCEVVSNPQNEYYITHNLRGDDMFNVINIVVNNGRVVGDIQGGYKTFVNNYDLDSVLAVVVNVDGEGNETEVARQTLDPSSYSYNAFSPIEIRKNEPWRQIWCPDAMNYQPGAWDYYKITYTFNYERV